jgi:hypothetical protein
MSIQAKFTTYLTLDLQGMAPAELNTLAKAVNERLQEVRKESNVPILVAFNSQKAIDVCQLYCDRGYVLTTPEHLFLSDISGQQLSLVTGGKKTLEYISEVLINHGFDPVY